MLDKVDCIIKIFKGDTLIIKDRKSGRKFLVKAVDIINGNEILLNKSKNIYFNFDMYLSGDSWVEDVFCLGDVEFTSLTNTLNEFPRY